MPARNRTAHKPLRPFTVDHFRRYAGLLKLDTGDWWDPEDFQLEIVEALFDGYREVWVVIPEGNTKTTTTAGIVLYYADWITEAKIPVAAASRQQCMTLFGQIGGFVRRSGLERKRFRVFEGSRWVTALRTGGKIEVWAANEDTADSQIPDLFVVEELHRHADLGLYRTWEGKLGKRTGQGLVISTRGEPGSEFEEAIDEALKRPHVRRTGARTIARSDTAKLLLWALKQTDDLDDLALVKTANPFSGVTLEELAAKRASSGFKRWHWARMTCGVSTQGEFASVAPEQWSGLPNSEIPAGATLDLGLDLGWVKDTTSATPLWMPDLDRRMLGAPEIIEPPGNGRSTEPRTVREALLRIRDQHPLRFVVLDISAGGQQLKEFIERPYLTPGQRDALAETLVAEGQADVDPTLLAGLGATAVQHGQTDQPMALAYERWMEAVREGLLCHPHHATLTRHVLSAVDKPVAGDRTRFAKRTRKRKAKTADGARRARGHIDALIAGAMVHSAVFAELLDPEPEINVDDYLVESL